jgi:glycosyltransferase involved in cell wall biosynthesis
MEQERCRRVFGELCPTERPFVLVLGRKDGAKRYSKVIDAVEALNGDGLAVDLIMIGPDYDRVTINSPHVKYLGEQPRPVVLGALAACDVVVNMSESESFGIVLVEAWMSRKPVVANGDCAAFAELVDDGVDGVLCSTVSELRDRIREMLSDPESAKRMGIAGYEKARKKYTWSQLGKATNRHLLSLIQAESDICRDASLKPNTGVRVAHV